MKKMWIILTILLISGCATPLGVKKVEQSKSTQNFDKKTHSLNLTRMISLIKKDEKMEYFMSGLWCEMPLGGPIGAVLGWDPTSYSKGPGAAMYHNDDELNRLNENKDGYQIPNFRVITREVVISTLKNSNVSINENADLELSFKVKDHKSNVCIQYPGIGPNHKGELYIKAEWEIYSKSQKKVLFNLDVESYAEKLEMSTTSSEQNVRSVYEDLTKKLINNEQFRILIDSNNLYIKDDLI